MKQKERLKNKFVCLFAIIISISMLIMTMGSCKPEEQNAYIRVMSYNILHPDWCSTADDVSVDGRIQIVKNIIFDYMPDVIGLQEAEKRWHSAIDGALCNEGTYKFACKFSNTGGHNMTTFLYNTKTTKLLDEYIINLDEGSDIRVLSVAVFERLSDGIEFVVTNSHPAPTSQADNYERNMMDLSSFLIQELQKYKDMPLITTGDFNTKEQSEYYTNFMENTGVKDAKYEAQTLVRNYNTFSGLNVLPKEGNSGCIDHIFVNGNAKVKLFDAIIDHEVEKASDHIPIYADIIIG